MFWKSACCTRSAVDSLLVTHSNFPYYYILKIFSQAYALKNLHSVIWGV
jgi:hypothetical protein